MSDGWRKTLRTRTDAALAKFRSVWLWVPLLGPLANCTVADHRSAFKEFVVLLSFATATFWLTAIFLKALIANKAVSLSFLFLSTMQSGELFIFAVAFLGPILITAAEDPSNARQFPGRTWHFLALIFVALLAAGFYALLRIAEMQGMQDVFDREFLFEASICVALTAITLRYLAIVYRKTTFNPERELKRPEEAFADQFKDKHAGDN